MMQDVSNMNGNECGYAQFIFSSFMQIEINHYGNLRHGGKNLIG